MKLIDPKMEFLLQWQYENFFELASARREEFNFVCKGCGETVKQWERKDHFDSHKDNREMIFEANRIAAQMAQSSESPDGLRHDVCVQCGEAFTQERKRGRPRKKCYVCQPSTEGWNDELVRRKDA